METEKLPNIHPGEVLRLDFMEPMGITAYRVSLEIGVQATRISEILHGKRGISADTAIRLGRYFGNSPQFWLNLQNYYDLRESMRENQAVYDRIVTIAA
jgi:antitoxin HigA-1